MRPFLTVGALVALTPLIGFAFETIEVCATAYCTTPVKPIPTTTKYATISLTAGCVKTLTPTSTLTPAPKTTTVVSTVYKTVTATITSRINTFTSTSTFVDVVSLTNKKAATTTTVGTSSGFVYASDAPDIKASTVETFDPFSFTKTQSAMATMAKRADVLAGHRPDVLAAHQLVRRTEPDGEDKKYYEAGVTCGVLVKSVTTSYRTVTATRTATVTATPSTVTKTVPITSSVTSTSLQYSASRTITATTTLRSTTTVPFSTTIISVRFPSTSTAQRSPNHGNTDSRKSPQTKTVTETVSPPQATYYEACGPRNMVNNIPAAGGAINGFTYPEAVDGDWSATTFPSNSAYDCCVACITDANCGGGAFYEASGVCMNSHPLQECSPTYGSVLVYYVSGPQGEAGNVNIFDGNCGLVVVSIGG
ncbi:hypothetical protein G7Y79_00009g026320 [Physcia stellaris]|nr:hypothetical protein G7Y79_00009g026320 [Physcia stellaris]